MFDINTVLFIEDGGGSFADETGWTGSGGGCSQYFAASKYQKPVSQSLCGTARAVPDVSYLADPASGVPVYDTEGSSRSMHT